VAFYEQYNTVPYTHGGNNMFCLCFLLLVQYLISKILGLDGTFQFQFILWTAF